MSTYYEYQDVGVMMAHKLMTMDGMESVRIPCRP